jgi:hypothetical protein
MAVLKLSAVKLLVVHRISLAQRTPENPNPVSDTQLDGAACKRAFAHLGMGTGGACPYHLLVRHNGELEQLLPLSVCGAHARGYNRSSWAIAVVGDPRRRAITDKQWDTLLATCMRLAPMNGGLDIIGHDNLHGGSHDPNKICPGKYLSVEALEQEVARKLPSSWVYWDTATQKKWIQDGGLTFGVRVRDTGGQG